MITLFSSLSPVKSSRRFGAGILASRPVYKADHTASDASWWAAESARLEAARELDRRVDELFTEVEAVRRLEAGLCC